MLWLFYLWFIDCIDKRFGNGTFQNNKIIINRKCNQKCLDAQKRIKKIEQLSSNSQTDKEIDGNKEK